MGSGASKPSLLSKERVLNILKSHTKSRVYVPERNALLSLDLQRVS